MEEGVGVSPGRVRGRWGRRVGGTPFLRQGAGAWAEDRPSPDREGGGLFSVAEGSSAEAAAAVAAA